MLPITVVIPTTGRPQLIRAIESVVSQTNPPAEIFVCFDGKLLESSGIKEQLLEFSSDLVKIIELEKPSGGPGKPRNVGIAHSNQPYIAILDDDDSWLPNKLEIQFNMISKDSRILAVGSNAVISDNGEILGIYFRDHVPTGSIATMSIMNPMIASSVLFNKKAAISVGCFSEDKDVSGIADYLLWSKLAMIGKIVNSETPLVSYQVVGSDSLSSVIQRGNLAPVDTAKIEVLEWGSMLPLIWFKTKLYGFSNFFGKIQKKIFK